MPSGPPGVAPMSAWLSSTAKQSPCLRWQRGRVEDPVPGILKGASGNSSTNVAVESCLGNVRPQVVRIPAVRQEMLDIPLVAAEGFRRREERMIDADIIPRHARGGEALLETLPHLFSVERYNKR